MLYATWSAALPLDFPVLIPSLIIFAAFFVRALTGFGAALISVPLLALFFPIKFVVPMELLFEIAIGALLLRHVLHTVDFRHFGPLLVGVLLGSAVGAHILASFANDVLRIVLAVLVMAFAMYMARTAHRPLHLGISHRWGLLFGLGGGVFGGLFGMSGPLIVLYLAHQVDGKEQLRGTLILLFFVSSLWSAVLYYMNGLFHHEMFRVALYLSPAFLLATALGYIAHFHVSEPFFRIVIAVVLATSGVLLLLNGV